MISEYPVVRTAALLLVFGLITTGLYFARDLLFPLAIAFLIWFIVASYRQYIKKLPFIGTHCTQLTITLISLLLGLLVFAGFGALVMYSALEFNVMYGAYQANLNSHLLSLSEMLQLNGGALATIQETSLLDAYLRDLFTLASGFFTTTLLVIFYFFFIFFEEQYFRQKLERSAKESGNMEEVMKILDSITHTVNQYLSLKTLISVGTGVAAYLVMLPIGLDFALLSAFCIFLFNYIPNIGPFIGTGIAVLFALLQFPTLFEPTLVFLLVGTVQVISGNIAEPLIMGNRLNLSPLVIMLSLVFWGYIWGIFGMFIAVPLTVVIMIVLAHFSETRSIAIWMSEDGRV